MYRIYIVEDDETIANLLRKNLSSWGYEVFCAENFSNILQEFAHREPQLVLLDLYFLGCRQYEYRYGNEPGC